MNDLYNNQHIGYSVSKSEIFGKYLHLDQHLPHFHLFSNFEWLILTLFCRSTSVTERIKGFVIILQKIKRYKRFK